MLSQRLQYVPVRTYRLTVNKKILDKTVCSVWFYYIFMLESGSDKINSIWTEPDPQHWDKYRYFRKAIRMKKIHEINLDDY